MRTKLLLAVMICAALQAAGCVYHVPDTDRQRHTDAFFHDRHPDPDASYHDPMMKVARALTEVEDDLRRDGTITVKAPDVWGDGNLMYFLQEFDSQLATTTTAFKETLQAYIAESDQMDVQATSGLSAALNNSSSSQSPPAATATVLTLPSSQASTNPLGPFDVLKNATGAVPVGSTMTSGVAVEPTEVARQQATYIDVCQALRRRHMGDDNSRAAGYGLYKFRIPVSVLPGRETHQGYSAIATLRAQVIVDHASLRYTYPKLVVADLVDSLTPVLLKIWRNPTPTTVDTSGLSSIIAAIRAVEGAAATQPTNSDPGKALFANIANILSQELTVLYAIQCQRESCSISSVKDELRDLVNGQISSVHQLLVPPATTSDPDKKIILSLYQKLTALQDAIGGPAAHGVEQSPVQAPSGDVSKIYGDDALYALRDIAAKGLAISYGETTLPKDQEVRDYLFSYFAQVEGVMEANRVFADRAADIILDGRLVAQGDYPSLRSEESRFEQQVFPSKIDCELLHPMWLVALQTGMLEVNLRKILDELSVEGKLCAEQAEIYRQPDFHFFEASGSPYCQQAVALWQTIVREEFPLHVFTLDSEVEEQNVYDAFSRQRQLQLALAYNVATGRFNQQQKLAMSRQLQLDETSINLNRTVVGFTHGEDTFGWYFYPRVQSPPPEASNIAAFARVLWSTGPTKHYDLKHRELEAGIRECEVLIAMPSFITKVSFDVTTNWERLTCPGASKESYESMLLQSRHIQCLKSMLQNAADEHCYRPGDFARLESRVEQLEAMLGMQTDIVNVPYSYQQTGTDLFDKGDIHLRPTLNSFYGLQVLDASSASSGNTSTTTPAAGPSVGATAGAVTVNVSTGTTASSTSSAGSSGSGSSDTSAHVFITGKNFHPTLTYVIVGGSLSSENGGPVSPGMAPTGQVTVINRQLIEVSISKLNSKLTQNGFEVRVRAIASRFAA